MNILKLFGFGIMMLWGSTAMWAICYPYAERMDSWLSLIFLMGLFHAIYLSAEFAKDIFNSIK